MQPQFICSLSDITTSCSSLTQQSPGLWPCVLCQAWNSAVHQGMSWKTFLAAVDSPGGSPWEFGPAGEKEERGIGL